MKNYQKQVNKKIETLKKHTSNDENRYVLQFVHLKGEKAYATDGRRLYITPRHNIAHTRADDGAYAVVKNGKDFALLPSEAGIPPDFEKAIPNIETYHQLNISANFLGFIHAKQGAAYALGLKIWEKFKCLINIDYLADALHGNSDDITLYVKDEFCPIIIDFADNSRVVIMPMHADKFEILA